MNAVIEPGPGGRHRPEEVRGLTEVVLRRVMVAGQVAQAMRRLLLADHSRCRLAELELGGWRPGVLPQLAADAARERIDYYRRHGQGSEVYVVAMHTGASTAAGDADLAALALADLASLHLRLGYADDCRRLVELAATEDLSDHVRRVLAAVLAWVDEYEQRQHDINIDHDGERKECADEHERHRQQRV